MKEFVNPGYIEDGEIDEYGKLEELMILYMDPDTHQDELAAFSVQLHERTEKLINTVL